MRPDEIRDLWGRFLNGALSAGEEEALARALQEDATLRSEFLDDVRTEGALKALGRNQEDAFVQGLLDRLDAEGDAGPFVAKVRSALDAEPPVRRRRLLRRPRRADAAPFFWIGGAAAAAVLIVLSILSSPPPREKPRRPAPEVVRMPDPIKPLPPESPKITPAVDAPRPESPPSVVAPTPAPEAPAPAEDPDRTRRIEQAMKEAVARSQGERPAPPSIPPALPAPEKAEATRPAVGTLEAVSGEVRLVRGGESRPARSGEPVLVEDGLATGAAPGGAVVAYPDGTRVQILPGTTLRGFALEGGKQLFIESGEVKAVVARQPAGAPMVFETPHGKATVLGTTLRLVVDKATRLEVDEGRVELRRTSDQKAATVSSGYFAIAGGSTEPLRPARIRIDEVLVRAHDARLEGGEWARVADAGAASGEVLEARTTDTVLVAPAAVTRMTRAYAEFTFRAEKGRTYHVWVRGATPAKGNLRHLHDSVGLEFARARVVEPPGPCQGMLGPGRAIFNGFGFLAGAGWVGGDGDLGRDVVPVTVQFQGDGLQRIRMYALETPVRIDAVWLSTTQDLRPAPERSGPGETK